MANHADHLTLHCPAKLNLTLAVGPPREDGLHPIASVMVALDFGDDLRLIRLEAGPSRFTRRFVDDAPKPQPIDWPIEHDLAYRAHAALEQTAGRELPIACEIDKRIAAGAGLGGGSSNAAAMLIGLNKLFGLGMDESHLLDLAQELGADIVFLVRAMLGSPAVLATGIGDHTIPLSNMPPFDCVLVFPSGDCPTGMVYKAFDEAADARADIDPGLHQAWAYGGKIPEPLNDLTDAAMRVCPSIADAIGAIEAQGLVPRLTGSGSAVFAVTPTQAQAELTTKNIRKAGLTAIATRFCHNNSYMIQH